MAVDESLFEKINHIAVVTPWLHGVVSGYANFAPVLFGLLLLAGWWTARRAGPPERVAAAVLAGVSTLTAVALNQPIVTSIHEPRPYTTHPGILVLAHRSADFSFPSDHAVMAGAVMAGVWMVSRRLGILAGIAALSLAFARVYIAAHYPHDVAAGLLLGAAVTIIVNLVFRRSATNLVQAASKTRLRPLLLAAATSGGGRH
ncbi:phosphatase PAP2 family protein [Actinopolymorpha pittospori]